MERLVNRFKCSCVEPMLIGAVRMRECVETRTATIVHNTKADRFGRVIDSRFH